MDRLLVLKPDEEILLDIEELARREGKSPEALALFAISEYLGKHAGSHPESDNWGVVVGIFDSGVEDSSSSFEDILNSEWLPDSD